MVEAARFSCPGGELSCLETCVPFRGVLERLGRPMPLPAEAPLSRRCFGAPGSPPLRRVGKRFFGVSAAQSGALEAFDPVDVRRFFRRRPAGASARATIP